jgi:hypothetical protein
VELALALALLHALALFLAAPALFSAAPLLPVAFDDSPQRRQR